ncbi:RraA family protein [Tundrisphaera lichenicola]|uniref:RraA family protein n=1 Tax=Tundrisphaera lichenicola TaxID=2029860 RepID=UPI003EC0DE9C
MIHSNTASSNASDSRISLAMMQAELSVAVVSDALDQEGYTRQVPTVSLRPLTTARLLVGRCRTTLWSDLFHPDPRPYDLELQAVDACRPDDVLIAAAGGSMRSGIWGELLSTAARNAGCLGAIVDGAVRDVARMTEMGFPVYARGTSPLDSKDRQRVTDVDVPVEIGGVRIEPGDLIFADLDGLVVVPQAVESAVIRRAWNKVKAEDQVREAIHRGMKATEAYETFGIL